MSWLEKDAPVRYALEHDARSTFSRPERSSFFQWLKSPRGLQSAGEPDAIDFLEAWLHASRSVVDFWQMTIRQQQDAVIAAWRAQLTWPMERPDEKSEV